MNLVRAYQDNSLYQRAWQIHSLIQYYAANNYILLEKYLLSSSQQGIIKRFYNFLHISDIFRLWLNKLCIYLCFWSLLHQVTKGASAPIHIQAPPPSKSLQWLPYAEIEPSSLPSLTANRPQAQHTTA